MQSPVLDVFQRCLHWLEQGQPVWLCTIVRAVGSSPRPVGSVMAFSAEGDVVGSVSGGCVEQDLVERVRSGEISVARPECRTYGVTAEENERLGLPCGGKLEILIEPLWQGPGATDSVAALVRALQERRGVLRHVDLATGAARVEDGGTPGTLEFDTRHLVQHFGPRMRMLLVGAGELARALGELALAMDYEVLLTDPRKERLAEWVGEGIQRLPGMPDDVIRDRVCDRDYVIITLSHDPRIDDMALMEALATDAWYVGALGSRKTTEKRLARLLQLGLPSEQTGRLHAPVGLKIGSKTPMEIAVAIMAELTQLRSRS
jgi:xanthine dehydrogenase accessory factor